MVEPDEEYRPRHLHGESDVDEPWLFRRPKAPRGVHEQPRRADYRTQHLPRPAPDRPPALPRDEYRAWESGEMPRVLPDPAASWTEIQPQAAPPIGRVPVAPHHREPEPDPEPADDVPAKVPFGVRVGDWFDANAAALISAGVILLVVVVGVVLHSHRQHITDLELRNQRMREQQAAQLARVAEAEKQAADAKFTAEEQATELQQLRSRVDQLEEHDETSGS